MMCESGSNRSGLFYGAVVLLLLGPSICEAQTGSEYARGVAAFRAGEYSAAADFFAQAETAAPGTTDALVYQAKALVHLQNFSASETTLRRYVALHSDSNEALYLLAFVLHRENKASESLEIYTRAAALKTPTADDLKIVVLDYVFLNDYANAIKWLEKAVELDPKNRDAWYYLGRAYYTRGLLPESRRAFLTVLDLDSHDARAENNLGVILESEAKPNEALDAYRKAIEWQEGSPHRSEQPYLNLGNLLLEIDRVGEAVAPLEKAVELAPDNASCHLKQWHDEHNPKPEEEPAAQSVSYRGDDYDDLRPHLWNFFQAVRSRKPVVQDVVFGHNAALGCHMANESYYRKSPVYWDSVSQTIKS